MRPALEYKVFRRKNIGSCSFLSKEGQAAKELVFFVRKEHAERFPSRGITHASCFVADFIFADGKLIKNRLGAL